MQDAAQKVGKSVVTTPSDLEVRITREFNAPRHLVFDAWTKPEFVQRWLLGPPGWAMPECEIDLRVGGAYRYVWRKDDGRTMTMGGTFREVKAPERYVAVERFGDGEAHVTNVFTESGGKTTSTHTMKFATKEARDAAIKTGMNTGIEASYARLDELLAAKA